MCLFIFSPIHFMPSFLPVHFMCVSMSHLCPFLTFTSHVHVHVHVSSSFMSHLYPCPICVHFSSVHRVCLSMSHLCPCLTLASHLPPVHPESLPADASSGVFITTLSTISISIVTFRRVFVI